MKDKESWVDMFISRHENAFMKLKKYHQNFMLNLPLCQTVHALWQINNQNRTEMQGKKGHIIPYTENSLTKYKSTKCLDTCVSL